MTPHTSYDDLRKVAAFTLIPSKTNISTRSSKQRISSAAANALCRYALSIWLEGNLCCNIRKPRRYCNLFETASCCPAVTDAACEKQLDSQSSKWRPGRAKSVTVCNSKAYVLFSAG